MLIDSIAILLTALSIGCPYSHYNEPLRAGYSFQELVTNNGKPFGYEGGTTNAYLTYPQSQGFGSTYANDFRYYCFELDCYPEWKINGESSFAYAPLIYNVNFFNGTTAFPSALSIELDSDNYVVLKQKAQSDYIQNLYYNVAIQPIAASLTQWHYFNMQGFGQFGRGQATYPNDLSTLGTSSHQNWNQLSNFYANMGSSSTYRFRLRFEFLLVNPDVYTDGGSLTYDNGYHDGYTQAISTLNTNFNNVSLFNLFGAIADTPFMVLSSLFDYEVFGVAGVTLYSVLATLLLIVVASWVIRRFI